MSGGFDTAPIRDAAAGALDAQRLVFDIAEGRTQPGTLIERLKLAQLQGEDYFAAFARVVEKRLEASR